VADEDERTARATVWGVVAGIFAAGAFATWPVVVQPHSTIPVWSTYVFSGIAVLALYLCFSTIWSWWPTQRSVEDSSSTASEASLPPSEPVAGVSDQSPPPDDVGTLEALSSWPRFSLTGPVMPNVLEVAPDSTDPQQSMELTPAITDRWHETSDGGKVPALMRLTHTSVFHPAYVRPTNEAPPFVKVGMVVAYLPLNPPVSGTELRAKFLTFLSAPAVSDLVRSLTTVAPSASWKSMAGHGPQTLEAALTISQDPLAETPIASAVFLPPKADESPYARNGRAATLLLYIEPRTTSGEVPPPSRLPIWTRRFRLALDVPRAFADFLSEELRTVTLNDPPAQCGIWLQSNQPLTLMVDTEGLRVLPGSSSSNWFMGWAFAEADGSSVVETARNMIEHLCEYQLHLDGYEHSITDETD
jgi:hypothetical protein